jgi:hypothetical protein
VTGSRAVASIGSGERCTARSTTSLVQPASASSAEAYETSTRARSPGVPAAPRVRHGGASIAARTTCPAATVPASAPAVKQNSSGTLLRFTTVAVSPAPAPGTIVRPPPNASVGGRYRGLIDTRMPASALTAGRSASLARRVTSATACPSAPAGDARSTRTSAAPNGSTKTTDSAPDAETVAWSAELVWSANRCGALLRLTSRKVTDALAPGSSARAAGGSSWGARKSGSTSNSKAALDDAAGTIRSLTTSAGALRLPAMALWPTR